MSKSKIRVFAYGSNMLKRQMLERCPSSQPVGKADLMNHALAFGGFSHRWQGAVATVRERRGQFVRGILYELTDERDLAALDAHEGAPRVYERRAHWVATEHGERVKAWVYHLVDESPATSPVSHAYGGRLMAACNEWRMSEAYLVDALLRHNLQFDKTGTWKKISAAGAMPLNGSLGLGSGSETFAQLSTPTTIGASTSSSANTCDYTCGKPPRCAGKRGKHATDR